MTEIVMECPQCGKKTIIQRKTDLYECIGCDFKRDLTTPTVSPNQSKPEETSVWPILLAALAIALLTGFPSSPPQESPSRSSGGGSASNYVTRVVG